MRGLARGLDSPRWHMRLWLGAPARGVRAVNRKTGGSAWDAAVEGRLLSLAGKAEPARRLLDRAIEALPTEAAPRAWRGELHLLKGNLDMAREDLVTAAALDPAYPWTYVYRAALWVRLVDHGRAYQDVETLRRMLPRSPVAYALLGILKSQENRTDEASRCFDRALRLGSEGWLYGLRAALSGTREPDWREIKRTEADLDRAIRSESSPWLLLDRARAALKRTDLRSGFADIRRAVASSPGAAVHLRAAALFESVASYPEAVEQLDAALALEPDNASAVLSRGRLETLRGRLEPALRDLERALRLDPENTLARETRVRVLVLRGQDAVAERALGTGPWPPGFREFWLGCLRCRQRRFPEARKLFCAAEAAEGLRDKARFSGWVARVLEREPSPSAPGRPEVVISGVGVRAPEHVSVGTVLALSRCDLIYSNAHHFISDFLALFPVEVRTLAYGSYTQAECANWIMDGFKSARRIGVLTHMNPQVLGGLSWELFRRAAGRGVSCRFLESVSMFETLPMLVERRWGRRLGLQVRLKPVLTEVDTTTPLVLYEPYSHGAGPARALRGAYSSSQQCFLYNLATPAQAPLAFAVARLPAKPEGPPRHFVVLLPPRPGHLRK